ncbi:MAG: molybdenum cofactor guanylyltransferase, partial [Acidimicrobiales bacterium]
MNITGAIFCGGKSTRMGTDKSVLEIAGTPMYQRVEIAMVDAGVSEVVALGGSDLISLRRIDDYESGEGPLSALIGGLSSEGSLLVCP